MFSTLPQFYNSEVWRSFRLRLIDERKDASGVLRDEHNGEILLRSYDIVLHHKKPLTVANVNDAAISLNPENIMIVSQKSHNEIHNRFGYCAERKVYYVYGAPCSGKTTFVENVKGNSDLIVDMDSIWQCITGTRYEKPDALRTNAFALRDCLLDMVRTRAGKWERAYVIDGGAVKSDRERKIALYGAEAVYIDTDMETCIKRLYGDCNRTKEQKKQWEQYVRRWFEDYTE